MVSYSRDLFSVKGSIFIPAGRFRHFSIQDCSSVINLKKGWRKMKKTKKWLFGILLLMNLMLMSMNVFAASTVAKIGSKNYTRKNYD